jgi:signal transduction histidine kinase
VINESGNDIIIEIADNGIGIAENMQVRVFDMFYRGTSDAQGAGLGLYLVKEAVNKLNGSIILKSNLGEGTTFKITFHYN